MASRDRPGVLSGVFCAVESVSRCITNRLWRDVNPTLSASDPSEAVQWRPIPSKLL